jgi:sodium-dependent phosphate cotransporter
VQVVATLLVFLFAIRLLGSATEALTPTLRRTLNRVVVSDSSALGLGWFASYVLANGSLVAALSVSLFSSELIARSQLFLMIVGSRLGGAAVVVFIGAFDYLNEELDSVREAMSLGLLTFLLTHSIYLPVVVVGYLALPVLPLGVRAEGAAPAVDGPLAGTVAALTDGIVAVVGPGVAFLLALGCIAASLRLFDHVLDGIDTEHLRQRYIVGLDNRWLSFGLGLVITGLTTSVAFSLGVIVPLYNRGHIKPREIMPFVLGANVGTLVDTLIVAVALGTPIGIRTVLVILGLGTLVSVVTLVWYGPYQSIIRTLQAELLGSAGYFVGFLLSLLVVPLVLFVL